MQKALFAISVSEYSVASSTGWISIDAIKAKIITCIHDDGKLLFVIEEYNVVRDIFVIDVDIITIDGITTTHIIISAKRDIFSISLFAIYEHKKIIQIIKNMFFMLILKM